MPLKFDKGLQYQFSLFFLDNGAEANELRELPSLISKQHPGTKSLGLKLAKRDSPATVMLAGRQGPPIPYFEWSAGSGIWKLTWTQIRLDLTFDALGYADIAAGNTDESVEPPTVRLVMERIARNLADFVKISSRPVNRMALIVTAVASEEFAPKPSVTVASKFFSEQVQKRVLDGEIFDLNARTNSIHHLDLALRNQTQVSIRINELETGSSNWVLEDKKESITLNWQLDVNTSPFNMDAKEFDTSAVLTFFGFAEEWISGRLDELRKLNDRS